MDQRNNLSCVLRDMSLHGMIDHAMPFGVLLDFSLNVKAATLIFISGCGSSILSAEKGKSGFIYNLVKSK